jgi:hypothetical protein
VVPKARNGEREILKNLPKTAIFGSENSKSAWFSRENEMAKTPAKSGQSGLFIGGIRLRTGCKEARSRQMMTKYAMKFKPQYQILCKTSGVSYVNTCSLMPNPGSGSTKT